MGIFLTIVLFDYGAALPALLGIFALSVSPILLELDKFDLSFDFDFAAESEKMAVYAFFFLVMTVCIQAVDLKRHPETYDQES
jgi:hypothetical protein